MKKCLLFFIVLFLTHMCLASVHAAKAIESDGEYYNLAEEYESYRLIDTKNDELNSLRKAHEKHILCLAISQDGQLLASSSIEGKIKIWNIRTKKRIETIKIPCENLFTIAFGPTNPLETSPLKKNPSLLTLLGHNAIVLLELETGNRLKTFEIRAQNGCVPFCSTKNDWITTFVLNKENTLLAAATRNGKIFLWNFETGELILQKNAHKDRIDSLAFNPNDPEVLASCSREKNQKSSIKIWQYKNEKLSKRQEVSIDSITEIAFKPGSPYSATLTSNSYNNINIWNMKEKDYKKTIKTITNAHGRWIYSLVFSNNGTILASASGDSLVKIWRADTYKLVTTLDGHTDCITALAISNNDKLIFSGSSDGTLTVWQEKNATLFDGKLDESMLSNHLTSSLIDACFTCTN